MLEKEDDGGSNGESSTKVAGWPTTKDKVELEGHHSGRVGYIMGSGQGGVIRKGDIGQWAEAGVVRKVVVVGGQVAWQAPREVWAARAKASVGLFISLSGSHALDKIQETYPSSRRWDDL